MLVYTEAANFSSAATAKFKFNCEQLFIGRNSLHTSAHVTQLTQFYTNTNRKSVNNMIQLRF